MRNVLVLGGTAWLGRKITERLLASGDKVTCLARGESGQPSAEADFVQAERRAAGAYTAVASQHWDEVIELAYEPDLVTGALDALAGKATHWTLVSSVSVYASNSEPNADETAELLDPVDLEDYGQAKVAAERTSREALGDRLLIVRPGLIAGPGDGSDRFSYWVSRFALAANEPVLTPVTDNRAVQVIDVQDLANWIVRAGREGITGVINATGDQYPLADVLALAAGVADFNGRMVSADDEWLRSNDVRYWAGPRSLPLWLPEVDVPFAQRDNSAFHAARGDLSDLRQTMQRILDAEKSEGLNRVRRSGLSRDEEMLLLDQLSQESNLQNQ
ncbi:NAD-dependent epimerase/dehydratase family protein [Arthrobacter castelli]|uniref:NAD-dependent epimerase/dehydratase family protein n=1 Tax=Arthrobacter castelli TaxID=271431 RepID=UPI00047D90AA|nr:NAD-dependent epimerase/dehydratase family protein [Arthrobacter castelli]